MRDEILKAALARKDVHKITSEDEKTNISLAAYDSKVSTLFARMKDLGATTMEVTFAKDQNKEEEDELMILITGAKLVKKLKPLIEKLIDEHGS